MIEIFADSKPLALYRDTTLTLEYNNSLFASDAIEGDVVYSFDIPVQGNEIALDFEHLPYAINHKKHACTIRVNGIDLVAGELVVQKVTDSRYSVAVMVNPYPDGWKERSIRNNDSEEIVVSNSINGHREGWKSFLKSTLNDDRIKFGPFVNENGYGDKNEDFGFYAGQSKGRVCNRVLFNATNDVLESSDAPFIRLFNESIPLDAEEGGAYVERNQQCLVPQIRLGRILENSVANMGYKYIDRIATDSDLYGIHIQSPSPLDAAANQFRDVPDWYFLFATRTANQGGFYQVSARGYCNDNPQGLIWVGNSSQQSFNGVKFQASGWYHIHCEIKPNITPTGEVSFKVVKWNGGTQPPNNPTDVTVDVLVGSYPSREVFVYDDIVYIDSSFVGVSLGVGFWLKTSFYDGEDEIWINGGESSLTIESLSIDQISYENIYRNRFRIAECFPNVTNVEFLKASVQSLGMAMYIDSSSGLVEILPYREMTSTKSIDLTTYVLTKETGIESPKVGKHTFRLSSLEEKEVSAENRLDDVVDESELPSPYLNIGKLCYVKRLNSFFKSERTQSEESNWRMEWTDQHFNLQDCRIGGSGDENIFKSGFKVPGNTTAGDYESPIPYVPFTMESGMFNSDGQPSENIVMLYYRGLEQYGTSPFKYQAMSPVSPTGFSLNAGSGDSVCEKYVKEWRKLVSLSKTIEYRMYLPIPKVIEVVQLLKPQRCRPSEQVRWMMVDNVKSMPRKISIQISNSDSYVLCEIEAAKLD